MDNGEYWNLDRRYSELYEFYLAMSNTFPETATSRHTLPHPLTRTKGTDETMLEDIGHALDEYIRNIMTMPCDISASMLVRNFFEPKLGRDVKIANPVRLRGEYQLR